jgi:hypothetical protein
MNVYVDFDIITCLELLVDLFRLQFLVKLFE